MNHMHYELARQRAVEAQRTAREADRAREARAVGGRRRGKEAQATAVATPAIPDYADEMFPGAGVPAPRPEEADGRHSRSAR
jgi:hypothetical protein